jgi:tRNA A37 threonylcarbamoyladenosine dehydratase
VIRGLTPVFPIESPRGELYFAPVTKNYEARFDGIRRLFGADGQERLRHAHVCVVGIGGVGSWAVEALARTGIGALTLVDFDEICISNVNRQLHAVTGEFGKPKIAVLAERVRAINPDCEVHPLQTQFLVSTADEILAPRYDGVLDAIDRPRLKALLVAGCRERGLPIVTTGGAGGRRDPTQIRIADLARSTHDHLLQITRNTLRDEHGFPRGPKKKFGVRCVYSPEAQVFPAKDGSVCERPELDADLRLDCRSGFGTACFVTGAFGFAAAAEIVRMIIAPSTSPEAAANKAANC